MFKTVHGYNKSEEGIICEMSGEQRAFLLGLVKEKRPKKVVEIGVAQGGTTYYLMETLQGLSNNAQMYSIDIADECYRDGVGKPTGFEYLERRHMLDNRYNHTMITGKILPQVIKEIGQDIDFVIIDTVHRLPGENLDYLCIYPYLKEKAIVVLHDIVLGTLEKASVATNVLLGYACGNKYWEYKGGLNPANIGAFEVTDETEKSIANSFLALTLPWEYLPTDEELKYYEEVFVENYNSECLDIYRQACEWNKETFRKREKEFGRILKSYLTGKELYIYGAGIFAERIRHRIEHAGYKVVGNVVSDLKDNTYDNSVIDRQEFINIKGKEKVLLIYAIKDMSAYYELVAEGIPAIVFPQKYYY